MLRSMTTFARVEAVEDGWACTLEVKSVNARYCDVSVRAPKWMAPVEDRVRKMIQQKLVRGRIEVSILVEGHGLNRLVFEPDLDLGRSYLRAVRRLAEELDLPGNLDLATLLNSFRDVISVREEGRDVEDVWARLEKGLVDLLACAEVMAEREGAALGQDVAARLRQVEQWIGVIGRRAREHLSEAQGALRQRVAALLDDVSLDQARLAQELAVLAERLDITEEIVRARSHVDQFRGLLDNGGTVGRRLDFLLQELFREINTMAAKSSDSVISHLVVDIKGELEKMREQVQNVV